MNLVAHNEKIYYFSPFNIEIPYCFRMFNVETSSSKIGHHGQSRVHVTTPHAPRDQPLGRSNKFPPSAVPVNDTSSSACDLRLSPALLPATQLTLQLVIFAPNLTTFARHGSFKVGYVLFWRFLWPSPAIGTYIAGQHGESFTILTASFR